MTLERDKDRKRKDTKSVRIKRRIRVGSGYMDLHSTYSSFNDAEKEVEKLQANGYGAMVYGGATHYLEGRKYAVYQRKEKNAVKPKKLGKKKIRAGRYPNKIERVIYHDQDGELPYYLETGKGKKKVRVRKMRGDYYRLSLTDYYSHKDGGFYYINDEGKKIRFTKN